LVIDSIGTNRSFTPKVTQKPKSGCGGPIIEGDLAIKNLIKKIGKGPKLACDLTREEAKAALTQILDRTALPEQIGAFLIALRIKSESAAETAGLIAALREKSIRIQTGLPRLLELAAAHDGKTKNLVLAPIVGAILAARGIPVLLTGGLDVPTKKGVTARHIFTELGWPTRQAGEAVAKLLRSRGLAYWDVADYSPTLEVLKELRAGLGLRTSLNTIEKAINPAQATHLCTGVFHGPYLKDLAEALSLCGETNVLCVQATEASSDLPLKKRTLFRLVKNGLLSEQDEIDPAKFDLKREANPGFELGDDNQDDEAAGSSFDVLAAAKQNVVQALAALQNQSGLVYEAIVYNAAVQFWFVGEANSVAAGIELAKQTIASGAVIKLLKDSK
jgi:anthranilate phosphoribosyltransferase